MSHPVKQKMRKSRSLKRGLLTSSKAIFLYLVFASIVLLIGINYYIVRTCPSIADEANGHIYPTNIHGVVYLTLVERSLLYLPWMILAAAFIFKSISEGVFRPK
jgi:hypothetical protein